MVGFFFPSLNSFSPTPLFIQLLPMSRISYYFRLHLDRIKSLPLMRPSGSCTLGEKYVIWFFFSSYMEADFNLKILRSTFQKHTVVCDCGIKVLRCFNFCPLWIFFSSNNLPLTNLHNISKVIIRGFVIIYFRPTFKS